MSLGITFSAGQKVTAADLQAMVDQIDSLTAPGWTSYGSWSTLLTASTTNPTQGDSQISAWYHRPDDSDICQIRIDLQIDTGGGFNAGSGSYRFLLPFAADADEKCAMHMTINESGVALRSGGTSLANSTHLEGWYAAAGAAIGASGLSTSWTTGDWVRINGSYAVA